MVGDEPQSECDECGGTIIFDSGEYVCEECNIVFSTDTLQASGDDFDRSAVVHSSETGRGRTTIWGQTDRKGNQLSPSQQRRAKRLQKWQRRFRAYGREGSEEYALSELDRMQSALGLPQSIRENAGVIYLRAADENIHKGYSIDALTPAVTYIAAKLENVPRSTSEIERVSRVNDSNVIATVARRINSQLGLEVPPATPEQYLPRFVSKLGLSQDVERRAREILKESSKNVYIGRSPPKVAASAIYAATDRGNENVSQDEIAEETDVGKVGISRLYRKLLDSEE